MKYCTCKNQSQHSTFWPSENLYFENKRMSYTLSINSALKISRMYLSFATTKFNIAFCCHMRTSILKIFLGPIYACPPAF